MIMFVVLLMLSINSIFASSVARKRSVTDVYIKGTTVVPHNMTDHILTSNIKNSSNHLHESVDALRSAINILFPKKDENERNFSMDRQSLLIGCLIKKTGTTDEQRRACKGLHEKNDKNIFYEFEDKSLEQKGTVKDIDQSPIRVEHMNVARIGDIKEKLINNTKEKIQKLIPIFDRFISNKTESKKMNLDSISDFSSSRSLINQSTPLDISPNTMANNSTSDKKADIFSNMEMIRKLPQYYSSYSTNEQKDDDKNFKMNEIISRFNNKKFSLYNQKNPSSLLGEKNVIEENNDDNYGTWDTNVDNETDITSMTNNNNEKFEQENKSSNEPGTGIWSISRFSNDRLQKNVLLTDLTKALETLQTIADGKGLDSDGEQISFKPADLRSIIKSQKFSWKFLPFLNTIKSTVEQLNTNNTTNSIN